MKNDRVFVGIPTHDGKIDVGAAGALLEMGVRAEVHFSALSLLTSNFNSLLCHAKNSGFDLFCLLHADIEPEHGWLKTMIDVMERHNLSVLSGVAAIKNDSGDTSTAFWNEASGVRRIPLTWEFSGKRLPDVLVSGDVQMETLLVNTGLMLMKLDDIDPERLHFYQSDEVKLLGGKYQAAGMPEDWNFSLDLARRGVRYGCTRLVKIKHHGARAWANTYQH